MKQLLQILLFLAPLSCTCFGQKPVHPGIEFDSLCYDFGNLEKGNKAICSFTFQNKDEVSVLITNVKASCGCTVPSWPKKPFLPGESGSISIRYNTQITGSFQKTIYIHTSRNPQPIALMVKGSVHKKNKKR
jgi:Protein of unknown function (DUF1573)